MGPVRCCLAPGWAEPPNPRCGEGEMTLSTGWRRVSGLLFDGEVTVSGDPPFQQGTTESICYVSSLRSHSQVSVKTVRAHLGFIPTHN